MTIEEVDGSLTARRSNGEQQEVPTSTEAVSLPFPPITDARGETDRRDPCVRSAAASVTEPSAQSFSSNP